jgi:tRNA(Ile)-lysidine synthase
VLVAVSGGVDSTALLHSLMVLRERLKIEIGVAHFDHKLRGQESLRDREFVKNLAWELNLPFHLGIWGETVKRGSLQVRARKARFAFFDKTVKSFNYRKIALGHNADDQTETVLMALMRGYDLKGLAGIRPVSGNRIHPLLRFTRQEILTFAEAEGLQWVEDSSNFKTDYARNRLRWEIIPQMTELFPQFRESLAKLSEMAVSIQNSNTTLLNKLWAEGVIVENNDVIILDIEGFLPYFNMLKNFAILDICARLGNEKPPTHRQLAQIGKLFFAETGAETDIASLRILKDRGKLLFGGEKEKPCELDIRNCSLSEVVFDDDPTLEYIDADKVKGNPTMRNWHPGDRFRPLGMSEDVKISDFLINNKISKLEKKKIMLLCDSEKVIWICGLRLDDRVKITLVTKKALRMTYRPEGQK